MKKTLSIAAVSVWVCLLIIAVPLTINPQISRLTPNTLSGQSATLMSDGTWLLLGGESGGGSQSTTSLWNPKTGTTSQIQAKMHHARAWHTATILPDGTVLIVGGIGSGKQLVEEVELFDPASQTFSP